MNDSNFITKEENLFSEKGFGVTIGFGERPAVIVVDMLKVFTDYSNPQMLLAANLDNEITEIKRIVDAARSAKISVIFTTMGFKDENMKDAGIMALKQKGMVSLRAGTPQVEIDPRLNPQKEDILLVKNYPSAFFGTNLASRLIQEKVDTLIIAGCTTSGCVRATVVDGMSYGFRPVVVREAVGDRSRAAHDQSLFDMQAKYADVLGVGEVLDYFQRISI